MIWDRIAWGLRRDYEVDEDLQKSKAFDEYLAAQGKIYILLDIHISF